MSTDARKTQDRTDSEPLDELDARALTEYMTVLADQGQARHADDCYTVTTESGSEYFVDLRGGSCTCPDAMHRDRRCKHQRRAAFATGARPIPDWVDSDAIDPDLGAHVDGPVMTDGAGIIDTGDDGVIVDDRDAESDVDVVRDVYTYGWEPYEQGGARFVRCERCGAECVPANPDRLAHRDGCTEGR